MVVLPVVDLLGGDLVGQAKEQIPTLALFDSRLPPFRRYP